MLAVEIKTKADNHGKGKAGCDLRRRVRVDSTFHPCGIADHVVLLA